MAVILFDCGDTLIDEATQVFNGNEYALTAELIPGAGELLHELKRRGHRLALVADGPAQTFHNLLGGRGLYDLFEAHAISGELGVCKPHPLMFRTALDALGVPPQEYGQVMMVGNNLERDVKGANELGLISVWIDWAPRRSKVPADASEIPQITIKLPLELLKWV